MSLKIKYRTRAVALPSEAIDACTELTQIRLLLLLAHDRKYEESSNEELAEALGCEAHEIESAVKALRATELLESEKKLAASAQTKNLDGEEMAAIIGNDDAFKQLIDECQNILGKMFTPSDISKIVNMRVNLGFDCETLLLLFFYYAEKLEADGRKCSVSYVEKSGYALYNTGIRTAAELQEYIKKTEKANSITHKLRRLFGIGERKITKKEQKFFHTWISDWGMPFDLIEYAYDITVDKTGRAGLEYMSKILSDWHDSGFTTVDQAEKSSAEFKSSDKYKAKFKEGSGTAVGGKVSAEPEKESSFDTAQFFEKALKRSYALMGSEEKK